MSAGTLMPLGVADNDEVVSLAFAMHSNPGAYALLIGAGVSMASGLPSAYEVLESLVTELAHTRGAKPESPMEWFEQTYGEPARYQSVLSKLGRSTVERQRLLRPYFEVEPSTDEPVETSVAHKAIARLVLTGAVRVIVTLNFDRLIERALRAEGIEPVVVTTSADIRAMAPLHTHRCCVVHLHGDYLSPDSMRNTDGELAAYDRSTARLLRTILQDHGMVVSGWSATYDPALRTAVKRWGNQRLPIRWFEPYPPSLDAQELVKITGGSFIAATADDGIGAVADAVESMNTRRARHPLTRATAAETAKRELSGRWTAIALHDRLAAELATLDAHEDFHTPNFQSRGDMGGQSVITARVREAASVPATLVATAARWGDESTDRWWLDEIVRFSTPRRGGGDTFMLSIRLQAGATLFWAAAVAASAAGRLGLVKALLDLRVRSIYSGKQTPVLGVLAEAVPSPFSSVRPILLDALSVGTGRIDDEWQRLEVIAFAYEIASAPDFEELAQRERELHEQVVRNENQYATATLGGLDTTSIQKARRDLSVRHGRAVGTLANHLAHRVPHLYAVQSDFHGPFSAPAVDRLIQDVEAERTNHPLVRALAISDEDVLSALRGVNAGVSRLATAPGRFGKSELWIDTGLSDEESAQ